MSDSRTSKASDSWFTTLDEFALLRVGGDDAPGFLQGQLSNDIHALDAPGETEGRSAAAQLSCFSSARGRVLSCLLVVRAARRLPLQLADCHH